MIGICAAGYRWLGRICRVGVLVAFSVLIVAVLTQVGGRLIGSSPIWTEELTRFALIYMTAFGAGLALMSGDLVNVDVVCEALPGSWPRRLRMVASLLTAMLCLALVPGAMRYVEIGALQSSPAMGMRMDVVHFSILLLIGLLAVFGLMRLTLDALGIPFGKAAADGEG